MKKPHNMLLVLGLTVFWLVGAGLSVNPVVAKSSCDLTKTTICTIELWLAYAHKKKNKEIRQILKDKQIKVLRRTIQYLRPKGGHPPINIVIGRAVSAEDARWVIDFALEYNDTIKLLIIQRLNPPNYVAVGTSAWDAEKEIAITPEQLQSLRDPNLTTEQFHLLYVKLTGEANIPDKFY